MPNPTVQPSSPTVSNARLERKLRLSLPEKDKQLHAASASGTRRNTISEDSLPRVRKKSKAPITPTIAEDEEETVEGESEIVIVNETKKSGEFSRNPSSASRKSAMSAKSARSTFTYDNGAFEGNLKTSNETPRLASRTPSLRSLEVYREQYCCCAKRTKCERYLLVTVAILGIIVIVLIIVIAILANSGNFDDNKMFNVKL